MTTSMSSRSSETRYLTWSIPTSSWTTYTTSSSSCSAQHLHYVLLYPVTHCMAAHMVSTVPSMVKRCRKPPRVPLFHSSVDGSIHHMTLHTCGLSTPSVVLDEVSVLQKVPLVRLCMSTYFLGYLLMRLVCRHRYRPLVSLSGT